LSINARKSQESDITGSASRASSVSNHRDSEYTNVFPGAFDYSFSSTSNLYNVAAPRKYSTVGNAVVVADAAISLADSGSKPYTFEFTYREPKLSIDRDIECNFTAGRDWGLSEARHNRWIRH
jgi:hypothetical protein